MNASSAHLTRVTIHLDRLTRNLRLLRAEAGAAEVWPVIKANAYGHGAVAIARHLAGLGCRTLCVAHADEARVLREAGIEATLLVLSATLPEQAEAVLAARAEPAVCTLETAAALDRAARRAGTVVPVHLKVDTGMGRTGIGPDAVGAFLTACRELSAVRVRGVMSHFPRADETDKDYSLAQVERFRGVVATARRHGVEVAHLANSAGLLDLPGSRLDAVRPGIALYGLRPSAEIANPRVNDLLPVLEWKSRITFLKEVPAGAGLSYGHTFRTARPTLVATIPAGYGDGLSRRLSSNLEVLVGGVRCPLVGRVTMDMSLVDVTALRGRVAPGDEVALIGRQGGEVVSADAMAERLGTINYEVVTCIGARVPRVVAPPAAASAADALD